MIGFWCPQETAVARQRFGAGPQRQLQLRRCATAAHSCAESYITGVLSQCPLAGLWLLSLPNACEAAGMVGGEPGLRPIVGLQMEFGNGVALLARDQIDLRQKLPISKALSLEVPLWQNA